MYKNDKAGISADQVMMETATRLTEKLRNELAEVRKKEVWSRKRKLLDQSLHEGVGHSPPKSQVSHPIRQRARRYITSYGKVVQLTKRFSSKGY